jgi:PAS domain S-box-containing protein
MDEAKKMATTLGEAHFRALLESAGDPIVVWDRDYNCLYANEAALDHAAATRDKLIGKSMREGQVYPRDLVQLWMARVAQVMETGEAMRVEDTRGAGDSLVYTESVLSPIRDADGNISAVGVVHHEVTERRHEERLLTIERDLGVALSAGPPLEETLRLCLDAALDASGMDGGAVYLVDEATTRQTPRMRAQSGKASPCTPLTNNCWTFRRTTTATRVYAAWPVYPSHTRASLSPVSTPLLAPSNRSLRPSDWPWRP